MTDQTIPADKVRGIINEMNLSMKEPAEGSFSEGYDDATGNWKRHLESLLPTPPLPTLADMTPAERAACRRMQADVEGRTERYVIVNTYVGEGDAALTSADGGIEWFSPDRVTPRPDLPRLEWTSEAPVPPNTLDEGSMWDDADALARACKESGRDQITVIDCEGDVSVWGPDGWETGVLIPEYDPYTILHDGKEVDQ